VILPFRGSFVDVLFIDVVCIDVIVLEILLSGIVVFVLTTEMGCITCDELGMVELVSTVFENVDDEDVALLEELGVNPEGKGSRIAKASIIATTIPATNAIDLIVNSPL
jgi:hypothetical protein